MHMVGLSRDQTDLLVLCADAYATPDDRGIKEDVYFFTAGGGSTVQHRAFPEPQERPVALGDIEELSDLGFIAITYGRSDTDGRFRVTGPGFEAAQRIRERDEALANPAVVLAEGRKMGLDWQTEVLPVLEAVNELYPDAPRHRGVSQDVINEKLGRKQGDEHTGLVLRKLEEAEYVIGKIRADQVEGPLFCEPGPRALELLSGWPTERGDAALAQFIQVLEKKIDETTDEEEKGKLRRVLTSVRQVSQGVMVAVISDLITGGG